MRYLLLTHVPAFAGQSPGVLRISDAWLRDLGSQTRALSEAGFDVTVATPVHPTLDARTLARDRIVDVTLADQTFQHVALPAYKTMSQFLARRGALRTAAIEAAADADIVQLGAGGHPVSLGQTLWPAIGKLGKKRVFVFADDPFPALQRYAASGRNPAKRMAKSMNVRKLETFCARAIREADLVFAHTPTIAERFARSWSDRCHTFDPAPMMDAELAADLPARLKRVSDKHRPLRIFCAGDTHALRGVDHLLRGLAKARRLSAKIELDLAGDLIGSAELMNLLRAEKLEPAVRLHGPVAGERLTMLLDACDVCVIPSLVPGMNPMIYLAAARGLPIVTYQSGVADARLEAAGAGMIIPRGETAYLSQALLDLSRHRERVATLSTAAHAWASTLTIDAVHRQRAQLVKECLRSGTVST
jgi:glycosyltransferase involved in cell wall biosynthesis